MNTLISIKEKVNRKIDHRNWEECLSIAFNLLIVADPGEVINITGPSRAGKTRMIAELKKLLTGEDRQLSCSYMVVVVSAKNASKGGSFSTKAFIKDLLDKIDHPILSSSDDYSFADFQKIDRISEHSYAQALISAFKLLGVRYLFIDESQHVQWISKQTMAASAVIDSWKTIAEEAQIILVIVGAYPILNILRKSAHCVGRKYQLELPRYRLNKEDLKEFMSIISRFDESLGEYSPLEGLHTHFKLLYQGTFGCIGLLRNWLLAALARAHAKNTRISKQILLDSRRSDDDLLRLWEEISEGEEILFSSDDESIAKSNPKPNEGASREKGKSRRKPFQRKPKRMTPGNRTKTK